LRAPYLYPDRADSAEGLCTRLRIEQGKGRKDRFAMLSPELLKLLRDWYPIARPLAVVPRIANTGIDAGYNLNIRYTDGSRDTIPPRGAFERFFSETCT
jgi:integrase